MNYLPIQEIQKEVEQLAKRIDAPRHLLPTFGYSTDFANPFVEVDAFGYHLVAKERNVEIMRWSSLQLPDLMYWIFEGITFSMAIDFELKNRIPNQDTRILMFEKQQELLSKIDPAFETRARQKIHKIIADHPFTKPE